VNIAWAFAVMGEFPADLMRIIYSGLFGSGTDQNVLKLSSIYDDGGLALEVCTH
jgi:hypothetical protein